MTDPPDQGSDPKTDAVSDTASVIPLGPDEVERLVKEFQPMAARLARRYSMNNTIDPDLAQVADTGLFLAAKRYRPETGAFRPFAMVTIVGELKKHLRSNGWTVKVPRRIQEATISVAKTSERLEQELKRSPTPAEVAAETGMSVETVLIALQAKNARFSVGDNDVEVTAADAPLRSVENRIDLVGATAQLSPESRELISMRYDQELTQRQIADKLDVSQSAVHRRLSNVLEELRNTIEPSGEDPQ